MEYTANYCVKKQEEFDTQEKISNEELKASTNAQGYADLQKTFEINRKKRVKALQEIKDKKYIRLKYRSQYQTRDQFYTDHNSNKGQRYSGQHQGAPPRRPSKTNLTGRVSRKNSSSNLGNRSNNRQHNPDSENTGRQNGFNNKINDLENQLNELRQQSQTYSQAVKNNHTGRRTNGNVINNRFVPNRNNNDLSDDNSTNNDIATAQQGKNTNPSHPAHGESSRNENSQRIDNIEVTEVLDYISTAMQTLGEFEKRFRQRLNTTPTHSATL